MYYEKRRICLNNFANSIIVAIFAIPKQNGALAERLGTGLQNLLQRFDSARHLTQPL